MGHIILPQDEAQAREFLRIAEIEAAKFGVLSSSSFQKQVAPWMQECFGAEISADTVERNHRFLEEALELVQSLGLTQSEAYQLVDYVFNRPVGDPPQEVGGVMVTLAALCLAAKLDMHQCGDEELTRIWTVIDKIRAKQATKPRHSPLPQHVQPTCDDQLIEAARAMIENTPGDTHWGYWPYRNQLALALDEVTGDSK